MRDSLWDLIYLSATGVLGTVLWVFVTLQVGGVIAWDWGWLLTPLWIWFVVALAYLVVARHKTMALVVYGVWLVAAVASAVIFTASPGSFWIFIPPAAASVITLFVVLLFWTKSASEWAAIPQV